MIDLTAVILTRNERENIGRTLARLSWAPKVIVLDSFSTDETLKIAREFPNVQVLQRAFDSFAGQCNWGLTQIETEWALSLDADYVVTPELAEEIVRLEPNDDVAGYSGWFRYCIHGHPLRDSLYPPRTVLYRRDKAVYVNEGHGHRVRISGRVLPLSGEIDHDDRKSLSHWLRAQDRYAKAEASHLLKTPSSELSLQDRLRHRVFIAPLLMPLYLLFVRGLIRDGWPGWYYVLQRTIAEMLLSLRLLTEKHKLEAADQ